LDSWTRLSMETAGTPPVHRLRNFGETRRAIDGIAATLRDRGVDLVHTHGVAAQIHAGIAAKRAARPVVSHVQDMFDPRWNANGLLPRASLAVRRDATIAASASVAASLPSRVDRATCQVIPNPVSTDLVEPATRPNGPLVVWCGRLQRWKGCHLFLESARRIL